MTGRDEFIKAVKKFMDNQSKSGAYVLAVYVDGKPEVIGEGDPKDLAALVFTAGHEVADRNKKW